MALSPEHEAQILRYHHAERWRIGTIAAQLGLHRDTVARVLAQAGLPRHGAVQRASAIGPLSALPSRDARAVSAPHRRAALRHGAGTRLPGALACGKLSF